MSKTWPDVENFFKNTGISYEQKDWFYLCQIKGRYFYYSPQTGKWRVKGKRAWKKSSSPLEFLTLAFKYSINQNTDNQNQTQNQNQNQSKKHQSKNNKRRTDRTSSQKQEPKRSTVDEIRGEFVDRLGEYLKIQRERNYKIGWIWHKLIEEFIPTAREICWLSVIFNYKSSWAYYRIQDFYNPITREKIKQVVELNRDKWLKEFQAKWGSNQGFNDRQSDRKERYNRQKNRQQYNKQQQYNYQTNQEDARYSFFYRMYRTHLEILKINFPFTKQELKTAYRKKALETHPDSGGTAEAFRAVFTAYEVLSRHIVA